jgi:hypothetical protein
MIHTLYEIERRDDDGRWVRLETVMDRQTAVMRCEKLASADDQPRLYRVVYEVCRSRSPSWCADLQ